MSLDWPFIRNAKVEAKDRRFLELFTRTLAKIPPDTLPLGTVRRVNLGRRGRMMGLVGLTIWGDLAYRTDGGGGARNTISGGTQTLSF